jgi:hypothetical protein
MGWRERVAYLIRPRAFITSQPFDESRRVLDARRKNRKLLQSPVRDCALAHTSPDVAGPALP